MVSHRLVGTKAKPAPARNESLTFRIGRYYQLNFKRHQRSKKFHIDATTERCILKAWHPALDLAMSQLCKRPDKKSDVFYDSLRTMHKTCKLLSIQ